jgi:hypothetical protein
MKRSLRRRVTTKPEPALPARHIPLPSQRWLPGFEINQLRLPIGETRDKSGVVNFGIDGDVREALSRQNMEVE